MSNWCEEIPFGPLTQEDFNKLGASFYDGSPEVVQELANARGVDKDLFLRLQLGEVIVKGLGVNPHGEVNYEW